ncbi:hypothetical protein JNE17039_46770 (plasmid) [Escherichia coli]
MRVFNVGYWIPENPWADGAVSGAGIHVFLFYLIQTILGGNLELREEKYIDIQQ